MKTLGFLMITVGFLGASWVSVQHETEINWVYFGGPVALAVIGVALARMGAKSEANESETLHQNMLDLNESIDRIVENIIKFDDSKAGQSPYDFYGKIDELFPKDLATFVEARKSIGHIFGLPAYADVMNSFAAGERYLNRVWSCSVDGYIDEALEYISRSRVQFIETQGKLKALGEKGNPTGIPSPS